MTETGRFCYWVGGAYVSQRHFGESSMEEAAKRFGGIDILINNGKTTTGPINVSDSCVKTKSNLRQTPNSVMEEYEFVNPKIKGTYFCTKAAVKLMSNENNKKTVIQLLTYPRARVLDSSEINSCTKLAFGVDPYVDSIYNIETLTKTIELNYQTKE